MGRQHGEEEEQEEEEQQQHLPSKGRVRAKHFLNEQQMNDGRHEGGGRRGGEFLKK